MNDELADINDFVTVQTRFEGRQESFEISDHASVRDFFESHLANSHNDTDGLKKYGIDVFKVKAGDIIKLEPSKWTIDFCKQKNIHLEDKYDYNYEIINILVEYYSKNPIAEGNLPKVKITLLIRRI